MPMLLKETVLKMIKTVAPKLYQHRFYDNILLQVVNDYISSAKVSYQLSNLIIETNNLELSESDQSESDEDPVQ